MSRWCTTGIFLKPLLFSFYINQFPEACGGADIQMHADDAVIYVQTLDKQQAASEVTAVKTHISNS